MLASPLQLLGEDVNYVCASPDITPSYKGEEFQTSPNGSSEELDEGDNTPFSTPRALLDNSEDGIEILYDAILRSALYDGVLISSLRREDHAAVQRILTPTAREPNHRLTHKQLKSPHEDATVPYISVVSIDLKLGNCLACLEGVPETPYEHGVFWLHLDYPDTYPLEYSGHYLSHTDVPPQHQ